MENDLLGQIQKVPLWTVTSLPTWENVNFWLPPAVISVIVIGGVEAVRDIAKQLEARADTKQKLTGRLPQTKPILIS